MGSSGTLGPAAMRTGKTKRDRLLQAGLFVEIEPIF
jgi:hypothetical protein